MMNHPHPGRIVRQDFLEPLGLTVTEAARVLGVARQTVNNLVHERAGISAKSAPWRNSTTDFSPEFSRSFQSLRGFKTRQPSFRLLYQG
jgi:addiction module HigA family antidote